MASGEADHSRHEIGQFGIIWNRQQDRVVGTIESDDADDRRPAGSVEAEEEEEEEEEEELFALPILCCVGVVEVVA
jgi:hypothetical protein